MNEKTKKLVMIVFTAIISLIVSTVAVALGVPVDDLMPQDLLANTTQSVESNESTCLYALSIFGEDSENICLFDLNKCIEANDDKCSFDPSKCIEANKNICLVD